MYLSEIIDDFVPAYSIRRHVSRTLVESCSRRARIIFFKQTAEIQISELFWLHLLLFHPFQIFEIMKLPLKSVFVSVVASAFEANHGNKSFGKMRNVIYCAQDPPELTFHTPVRRKQHLSAFSLAFVQRKLIHSALFK